MSTAAPARGAVVNIAVWNPQTAAHEPQPVLAEATTTPGLFVTPRVDGAGQFDGNFNLTHGPSGLMIPVGDIDGIDVHTARRIATALGDVPVDWTQDVDTIKAQVEGSPDLGKAIVAAVKAGKYPPSDGRWDDNDPAPPPIGPGDWPRTTAQATARQVAAAFTRAALQRNADIWKLVGYKRDDAAAMRVYVSTISAMIGEYGLVSLLRVLADIDQDAADAAARDFWEACEAGDSMGEWLAEWGLEYGIPTPEAQEEFPGLTLPPPLEYDAVMRAPLMYPENGTVGSLRLAAAELAYLGQQRFGALSDEMGTASRTDTVTAWSQEKAEAHRIAHGCSFYGWSIVALLGWLAKEHPLLAIRAARMVDDIGTNGGNDFCDDVPCPPTTEAATTAGDQAVPDDTPSATP